MSDILKEIADAKKKPQVVDVRSGDTVKVYQKIKEGEKTRIQMFDGVVIRTDRKNSLDSRITVRKITNGVGVEKSFLLHSPNVEKVEITARGKVRRNYLTFLRARAGKSARLVGKKFDRSVNDVIDPEAAKLAEEAKLAAEKAAAEKIAAKEAAEAELKAKQDAVSANRQNA